MTYLAIKYIENANPIWFRGTDLGPMEDITASIKEHGVRRPVLLRPDFLLIDGARRLTAAKNLGLQNVPIQICNGWADIMQHFRPADPDCYPMDWLPLLDFWNNVLKPMHQQYRFIVSVNTRKYNDSGLVPRHEKGNYSGLVLDLSTLYGVSPANIRLFRDYFARLQRREKDYPIFAKGVYESLPHGEEARNLSNSRVLKAVFESLMSESGLSEEEAVLIFQQRLNDVSQSERPRVPRAQVRIDPRAPMISTKQIKNLLELLGRVAFEAHDYRNFKLSDDQGSEFVDALSESITELNGLRKRLQAAMAQANQET